MSIKEVRALLRLVRGVLPKGMAGEWNRRLQRVHREMGATRDEVTTAGVLGNHAAKLRPSEGRAALRRALPRGVRRFPPGLAGLAPLLEQLDRQVVPELRVCPWRRIRKALDQAVRKAGRLQSAAGSTEAPAVWHRWRRRVKDLAYQIDFLPSAERADLGDLRRKAWRLQSRLGELQDLVVAQNRLKDLDLPSRLRRRMREILRPARRKALRRAWRARLDARG